MLYNKHVIAMSAMFAPLKKCNVFPSETGFLVHVVHEWHCVLLFSILKAVCAVNGVYLRASSLTCWIHR